MGERVPAAWPSVGPGDLFTGTATGYSGSLRRGRPYDPHVPRICCGTKGRLVRVKRDEEFDRSEQRLRSAGEARRSPSEARTEKIIKNLKKSFKIIKILKMC